MPDIGSVAERVNARLAATAWDTSAAAVGIGETEVAAEIAVFALGVAGRRRQARRGGRFGRLVVRFALAACLALSSIAAACDKPDAGPEATQTAINELATVNGSDAVITANPRAGPAWFSDLLLVDAGSAAQPWAVLRASGSESPILVDRVGAGLDSVGSLYRLAAQPVAVGTRDGPSQFLDPLQPAISTGSSQAGSSVNAQPFEQPWSQDERYLAPIRAIVGQPTVLDAAYNAAAAAAAGGTHSYVNGVVLRVEPDKPVLTVIDRKLLESGSPTRAEDVVYVAIRASEQSLYNPGQVVNLRDVAINKQSTDVNGQSTTLYVANAALDGARVEPTGSVDLQSLLQPRLTRVDQDLNTQAAAVSGTPPAPSATATAAPGNRTQPVIVEQRYGGPSFVDDFLIWMWLTHSGGGWYRGSTVIINNPPPGTYRSSEQIYYSPPPTPGGSSPSTVASSQAASRSTALEASRSAVSGQAAGTGGGVAATNKSAANASTQVSAATAKSASVASDVSAASTGKSISSVASNSSSTAARSAGTTSAGTGGSAGVSSSSSGSARGSSSTGSSGGKGIGGASSSSSGGGFGGRGSSGSSSS